MPPETSRCTRIAELLNFSVKRFCSFKYMRVFAPTGEDVRTILVHVCNPLADIQCMLCPEKASLLKRRYSSAEHVPKQHWTNACSKYKPVDAFPQRLRFACCHVWYSGKLLSLALPSPYSVRLVCNRIMYHVSCILAFECFPIPYPPTATQGGRMERGAESQEVAPRGLRACCYCQPQRGEEE